MALTSETRKFKLLIIHSKFKITLLKVSSYVLRQFINYTSLILVA